MALDNITKMIIIVITVLIIYGLILYFKNSSSGQQEESYDNIKKNNSLVELYFNPTCPHCVDFKPEWDKLIKTNACTFKSYNCSSGECTADIEYVPLVKINGKVYTGNMNSNSILTQINKTT